MNASDPLVRVVFTEIEKELGFELVPNVFRAMAAMPEMVDAYWCQVRASLLRGKLSRELKEMIGVTVSIVNGTTYSRSLCLQSLTRQRTDLDTLAMVAKGDLRAPGLSRKESAILAFARTIAIKNGKLRDDDYLAVYDVGVTFDETLEIAAVVQLFTALDRFAEVARVPLDLW